MAKQSTLANCPMRLTCDTKAKRHFNPIRSECHWVFLSNYSRDTKSKREKPMAYKKQVGRRPTLSQGTTVHNPLGVTIPNSTGREAPAGHENERHPRAAPPAARPPSAFRRRPPASPVALSCRCLQLCMRWQIPSNQLETSRFKRKKCSNQWNHHRQKHLVTL